VMWRAWTQLSRDGQAFGLAARDLSDRTTAASLAASHHGPQQGAQAAETKPPAGRCSRDLDRSLGPTRARTSRNRPLERSSTIAGLAGGWAGLSCRYKIPLTLHQHPNRTFPRCVCTRWAGRDAYVRSHNSLQLNGANRGSSARSNKALATVSFPYDMVGRALKHADSFDYEWPAFRRLATVFNDLWPSLVDEPTAQLHRGTTQI
jgi:hypothetical protein